MEICTMKLSLKSWKVSLPTSEKVVGENGTFFFTETAKYRKTECGTPHLIINGDKAYLQLVMTDADEAKLRDTLSSWISDKAFEAWSMKMTPAEPEAPQYGVKISYSWGDGEVLIHVGTFEDAWSKAKQMALAEAEITGISHECEIELMIDKRHSKITLHYTYDDTYCFYDVVLLSLEV